MTSADIPAVANADFRMGFYTTSRHKLVAGAAARVVGLRADGLHQPAGADNRHGEGLFMRRLLLVTLAAVGISCLAPTAALAGAHRLGLGANYWKTVNNLDTSDVTNIDESGLSWIGSYQYAPEGIFKLEFDLEYYPSLIEGEKTFWSPEAFVLVGGTLYAGAGIGIYYSDGEFNKSPFYMLRAGLDFALLPFVSLDINANYRFNNLDTFDSHDLKTDTIRLGAAVRIAL
jgi:hypothetical protein